METPELISLGRYQPGDRINIVNTLSQAMRYEFTCGDYGSLSITLPPGGSVIYTVGTLQIHGVITNADPAGIRPVGR